jgi:ABC-type branched-subunit amino acid transport system substrate-binding protein
VTVNQDTAVKVGLLTPQTGGLSAYSAGFENAANLAIADINADTDFDGYTFTLDVYDSQTTPEGASAGMTAAVTAGDAYVVGAAGSSNTLAAGAIAKEQHVPLISYASTSPALTTFEDDGYVWRTPPSDALQGQVIADLAIDAGFYYMVIVTLDNAYGAGLAEAVKSSFEGGDREVVRTITYAETQTDFSSIVSQIEGEDPEVIVAISYATDGSQLFLELQTQGVTVPVIGADGVADEGIFDEATGTAAAMEGYVLTKPSAVNTTESTAFAAAYAAAYPSATGDIYTGETYDAVMAGALAVLAAGSTDGAAIKTALASVSFNGATGSISFDANGDSTAGYYLIQEVASGALNPVANWEAGTVTYTDATFSTGWKNQQTTHKARNTEDSPFPIFAFFSAFALAAVVMRKRKNL